jgi:hypothetical protein
MRNFDWLDEDFGFDSDGDRTVDFEHQARHHEFNSGLVADFMEALSTVRYSAWADAPSIENLREYQADMDSAYNSQVGWEASQAQTDPVNVGGYSRTLWGV